jgi:hypothetical protein
MYSDCEKAVRKITGTNYKGIADHLEPESDLLQEARSLYKNLPIKISLQWVDGHSSGDALTIGQKLNHQAHQLAYNYLKNPDPVFSPSYKVITPPSEKVSVYYNNSTLTSKLFQTIHHQLHSAPLITTICKEANWDIKTFRMVDWSSFGKAFQQLPKSKQISYSKLTHGIINTNVQNYKFYGLTALCPCCKTQKETVSHVFTCQAQDVLENRRIEQAFFLATLQKIKTHPKIISCIQHGIMEWERQGQDSQNMRAPTIGSVLPLDIALTQAFRDQSKYIGWDHFLRGRISPHWSKAFAISNGPTSNQRYTATWGIDLVSSLIIYSSSFKFQQHIQHIS